ncbi:MAG TPA: hypothetical protein VH164_01125 [Ktedonobacteraceae bacterium]|nr:hypothetical protein [Ktedonobacteraceae bacterium]
MAVSITTGWDWVHMTIGPFTVQMTRYEARQTALLLKTTLAQGRQLRPYGEEIKMWGLDTGRSL